MLVVFTRHYSLLTPIVKGSFNLSTRGKYFTCKTRENPNDMRRRDQEFSVP